jgi:hypothetical protein
VTSSAAAQTNTDASSSDQSLPESSTRKPGVTLLPHHDAISTASDASVPVDAPGP